MGLNEDGELEPLPVLCMECRRTPATIERGKARWCAACITWIERRKDLVNVFDRPVRRATKSHDKT